MFRSILMMFGMNYLFRRMGRGGYGGSRMSRSMRYGPRW